MAVDDDLADRRLAQRALEREFDLCVCGSGEEALTLLAANPTPPWDVLVVDYRLPGMSGVELAERVRALTPDVQILIVTADHSVRREHVKAELKHKPLSPRELLTYVRDLAALAALNRTVRGNAGKKSDPTLQKPSTLPRGRKPR
jgi:CheY-like chemotaxis protein